MGYQEWRKDRVRFSAMASVVKTPKDAGSSLVAVSGIFRGYFTPHRSVGGMFNEWDLIARRLSAYVGVGKAVNPADGQLSQNTLFHAGLGFDFNYQFTLTVGATNLALMKDGSTGTRRVNQFTLGLAINSEFMKPLLGMGN